ncbi:MAG: FHA domain-containing protein [Coleofasciculus sp. Co-bin14]|nr:FHA domain-containing protein [Coleofasciculus sp. Co-bin14]
MYVQLMWEDPETGELQQPLLVAPIAIGRETDQLPEQVGGQKVSRLELGSKEISRYHALITVTNQQMYITDQSSNGTFLNGQPIRPGIQPLSTKDTLRIGPYKMTANLIREGDLNATEQNRDRTNLSGQANAAQKNMLMVWGIGGLVLLLMGVGGWLLVSTLLERSRPRVPESPAPRSSLPLLNPVAALSPEASIQSDPSLAVLNNS